MSKHAEDGRFLTVTQHSTPQVYHTRECPHVQRASHVFERPASYVEWHGLKCCEFCEPLEVRDD